MVKVFACKFEENEADILVDKMSLLALNEKERIDRYKQTKDRCMSFMGLAIVHAFCEKYNDYSEKLNVVKISDIFDSSDSFKRNTIDFDKEGKPYFEKDFGTFFNISHSGEWCFVAFSDGKIGIDVQKIKELKGNVAQRFFNEKDNLYINGDSEKAVLRTIEVWCVKESYVKMLGTGLGYGLSSFYEDFTNNLIVDTKSDGTKAYFYKDVFLNDYVWSYCILCDGEGYTFPNNENRVI